MFPFWIEISVTDLLQLAGVIVVAATWFLFGAARPAGT